MIDSEITNVLQEVKKLCEQNQVLQEKLDKSEKRNQEESENPTHTIIDLKLQVEEATRIKESISNSLKDKLEKSATEIEKHSEEIVKLKRLLEDKEKELICKLQDKGSEISTYKTEEILVETLRRKKELEIKSLKVHLLKVCLTKFEFEKDLSKLENENRVLKGQL